MKKIEISDEILRKVNAFKEFIDYFLGEKLPSDSAYIEMILTVGLNEMLQDPLPDEEIFSKTMVDLFNKNPEFIVEHIIETMERGALIRKEEAKEIVKNWKTYIT